MVKFFRKSVKQNLELNSLFQNLVSVLDKERSIKDLISTATQHLSMADLKKLKQKFEESSTKENSYRLIIDELSRVIDKYEEFYAFFKKKHPYNTHILKQLENFQHKSDTAFSPSFHAILAILHDADDFDMVAKRLILLQSDGLDLKIEMLNFKSHITKVIASNQHKKVGVIALAEQTSLIYQYANHLIQFLTFDDLAKFLLRLKDAQAQSEELGIGGYNEMIAFLESVLINLQDPIFKTSSTIQSFLKGKITYRTLLQRLESELTLEEKLQFIAKVKYGLADNLDRISIYKSCDSLFDFFNYNQITKNIEQIQANDLHQMVMLDYLKNLKAFVDRADNCKDPNVLAFKQGEILYRDFLARLSKEQKQALNQSIKIGIVVEESELENTNLEQYFLQEYHLLEQAYQEQTQESISAYLIEDEETFGKRKIYFSEIENILSKWEVDAEILPSVVVLKEFVTEFLDEYEDKSFIGKRQDNKKDKQDIKDENYWSFFEKCPPAMIEKMRDIDGLESVIQHLLTIQNIYQICDEYVNELKSNMSNQTLAQNKIQIVNEALKELNKIEDLENSIGAFTSQIVNNMEILKTSHLSAWERFWNSLMALFGTSISPSKQLIMIANEYERKKTNSLPASELSSEEDGPPSTLAEAEDKGAKLGLAPK